MSDIPSLYKSTSYWDFVRCQIEHEYWRNVQANLSIDDMTYRVGELADCLQRDFEFTTRAVGGDWYIPTSNSNLRMMYDYFAASEKMLAVNPRVAAVETAARRLLPSNVEWELFEDADGTADAIITRIRPPASEADHISDYRNFF